MEQERKYRRIPMQLISHFRKGNGEVGMTVNVSLGGAFVETNLNFTVGQPVEFDIVLPGGEQRVSVEAVVRWVRQEQPRGIGVEFLKLTVPNKIALRRYIELLTRKKSESDVVTPEKRDNGADNTGGSPGSSGASDVSGFLAGL